MTVTQQVIDAFHARIVELETENRALRRILFETHYDINEDELKDWVVPSTWEEFESQFIPLTEEEADYYLALEKK